MAHAQQDIRTRQVEEVAGYTLRLSVFEAEVLRAMCGKVAGLIGPVDKPTARNATDNIGRSLDLVMPRQPKYCLFDGYLTVPDEVRPDE